MTSTNIITIPDSLDVTAEPETNAIAVIQDQKPSLLQKIEHLREEIKFLPVKKNTPEKFPSNYNFNRVISASALLSSRFPMQYSPENYEKSRRELYMVLLGLVAFTFFSFISWGLLRETNYTYGGDFVYNTGLIGGIFMLLALFYSILKRIPALKRIAGADAAYYFHIVCGAVGALLIIAHSSFDFGSINSSIAFFSMIFILVSGALGRYLYTQCTTSLHRAYTEIKQMEKALFDKIASYDCKTAKRIRKRLSRLALRNFGNNSHILDYFARGTIITFYSCYYYVISKRDLYRIINSVSILSDLDKDDIKEARKIHRRELGQYIFKMLKMGYTSLLEQLFHHWRVLHIPVLYLLVATSIVHIVVVHMY